MSKIRIQFEISNVCDIGLQRRKIRVCDKDFISFFQKLYWKRIFFNNFRLCNFTQICLCLALYIIRPWDKKLMVCAIPLNRLPEIFNYFLFSLCSWEANRDNQQHPVSVLEMDQLYLPNLDLELEPSLYPSHPGSLVLHLLLEIPSLPSSLLPRPGDITPGRQSSQGHTDILEALRGGRWGSFLKKKGNWVFATNSNFLIRKSLQPDNVN